MTTSLSISHCTHLYDSNRLADIEFIARPFPHQNTCTPDGREVPYVSGAFGCPLKSLRRTCEKEWPSHGGGSQEGVDRVNAASLPLTVMAAR